MDTLPLHIEYLLTRHDCVIVPGIGALIASEREPHIDFERGIILPRRREISFNSSVVTDDGLLSHSIARRENLSYEDAHRLLTHLTARMAEDLKHEGEASLGRVGRLRMDADGFISFEPRLSRIDTDIMVDVRLDMPKAETETAKPAAAVSDSTPETPAEARKSVVSRVRTIEVAPDRYVFTISKRAVHAAAMLVMILTVGLSLLIPSHRDEEQKASVIPVDEFLHRPLVIEVDKDKDAVVDSLTVYADIDESISE